MTHPSRSQATFSPENISEAFVVSLLTHRLSHIHTEPMFEDVKHIADTSTLWIEQAPLYEVAVRLLVLHTCDSTYISGHILAAFTKRLLAAELAVGGPYRDTAKNSDILTNAAIAQLCSAFNTPLPNLQTYLENSVSSPDEIPTQFSWLLMRPYKIASYSSEVTEYLTKHLPSQWQGKNLETNVQSSSVSQDVPPSAAAVKRDIAQLAIPLQQPALKLWQSINSADTYNEISSLTSEFIHSLVIQPKTYSTSTMVLDRANFYAWMAYTIYDDFIDDEGNPQTLPLANIFHRRAFALLLSASKSDRVKQIVSAQFDRMDEANLWEVTHCRFITHEESVIIRRLPRYNNRAILAKRAGVHGLGPIIILESNDTYSSEQVKHLRSYLQNYLIARQLNDDLHDWKDDLRNGHASFVVTFLLRSAHIRPGTYKLDSLIKTLQHYFWQTGLEQLHALILHHTDMALSSAHDSHLFVDNATFISMTVQPIIDSVHSGNTVIKNKKEFLRTYTT